MITQKVPKKLLNNQSKEDCIVELRDSMIATQEFLKWHEKHAARGPLIGELAKQQEKYRHCITRTCKMARNVCNKRSGNSHTWKWERRIKRDC
jgi:hypothetical protein